MNGFAKWSPLIGGAYLVLVVGLRVAGMEDAAKAVESMGNLVGAANGSPVSYGELMAAATLAVGIVRKVSAEVQKAKATPYTIRVR